MDKSHFVRGRAGSWDGIHTLHWKGIVNCIHVTLLMNQTIHPMPLDVELDCNEKINLAFF